MRACSAQGRTYTVQKRTYSVKVRPFFIEDEYFRLDANVCYLNANVLCLHANACVQLNTYSFKHCMKALRRNLQACGAVLSHADYNPTMIRITLLCFVVFRSCC